MNKCEICKCNKICDHNNFGFEICDSFIPTNYEYQVAYRFAQELKTRCIKGGIFPAFINATIDRILIDFGEGKYKP